MLPVGKRRWQRVTDAYEKGPRSSESNTDEEDDHHSITDKTRLLSVMESSNACLLVQGDGELLHPQAGCQAQDQDELPSQSSSARPSKQQHSCTTETPQLHSSNQSKRAAHLQNPALIAPLPIKKHCNHASWQGFKQLLRKQFTPPFPFGKGVLLPEEMQHLRARRIEGAMQRSSKGKVLGSSTNLVELRRLDATIQNGINKSAFVASARRGRSKGNLPCNHFQSLGTTKSMRLGSKENVFKHANVNKIEPIASKDEPGMPIHNMKENKIFRKLKRQTKKENVMLLANAIE